MPKKAIFVRDYNIPGYDFTIPEGTEAKYLGKYIDVIINGEEYSLPDSVITDGGIFKTPFITSDNKVFNPGDKIDVVCILADIECKYGYGCVEISNLMIIDEAYPESS